MMKKMWKNRSGVSPVIATILMVAITVVLAAVLYVMVMGFGGTNSSAPSGAFASAEKSSSTAVKFTFSSMSKDTKFTDCKFTMGYNSSMAGAQAIAGTGTDNKLTFTINSVTYTVTFYDLAGDGKISTGDYATISTGSALVTGDYTATLLWAQDGSQICTKTLSI